MKITLNQTLEQKGKSQYWLAHNTGIAASTINNLCNGKTSSIQFDVLQKICNALECNVNDVIEHDVIINPIEFKNNKSDTSK